MEELEDKWVYVNNELNTQRYVLGEKGVNMVGCIGINPSTAEPNSLDPTLGKVKAISKFNNFNGWVMYNIYPQRATNPLELDSIIDNEIQNRNNILIKESIQKLGVKTIWVAYGDLIESRDYLPYCLYKLYQELEGLGLNWKIIENLTKKGHPRHPLYKKIDNEFKDFNMKEYIENRIKPKAEKFANKLI